MALVKMGAPKVALQLGVAQAAGQRIMGPTAGRLPRLLELMAEQTAAPQGLARATQPQRLLAAETDPQVAGAEAAIARGLVRRILLVETVLLMDGQPRAMALAAVEAEAAEIPLMTQERMFMAVTAVIMAGVVAALDIRATPRQLEQAERVEAG